LPACKLIRVNHTGITVADLDRASAFFRDVLGFAVSEPVEHTGASVARMVGVPDAHVRIAFCSGGGHTVELIQYLNPPPQPSVRRAHNESGFTHIALLVEDIDVAAEAIRAAGFELFGTPETVLTGPRKGGRNVYAQDSGGLVIELQQPPPVGAN
jgi:catechol 2,3-dioxygenase-like lactoylglutathione lyase family enzyme